MVIGTKEISTGGDMLLKSVIVNIILDLITVSNIKLPRSLWMTVKAQVRVRVWLQV